MSIVRRRLGAAGAGTFIALAGLAGAYQVQPAAASAHIAHNARTASLPGFQIGSPHSLSQKAWAGYYDGHKDTYLNTDVSVKSQAKSLGINFAPVLAHSMGASSPMYFVKGRAAAGQIAVFGSEPGGSDYSPLWREVWVTWKAGAKPKLLTSDNQIIALAKAGKLTETMSSIVLNAPVTSVGH
jgi:hypothetical protein